MAPTTASTSATKSATFKTMTRAFFKRGWAELSEHDWIYLTATYDYLPGALGRTGLGLRAGCFSAGDYFSGFGDTDSKPRARSRHPTARSQPNAGSAGSPPAVVGNFRCRCLASPTPGPSA